MFERKVVVVEVEGFMVVVLEMCLKVCWGYEMVVLDESDVFGLC